MPQRFAWCNNATLPAQGGRARCNNATLPVKELRLGLKILSSTLTMEKCTAVYLRV